MTKKVETQPQFSFGQGSHLLICYDVTLRSNALTLDKDEALTFRNKIIRWF